MDADDYKNFWSLERQRNAIFELADALDRLQGEARTQRLLQAAVDTPWLVKVCGDVATIYTEHAKICFDLKTGKQWTLPYEVETDEQ